jgi:hypothetical protein
MYRSVAWQYALVEIGSVIHFLMAGDRAAYHVRFRQITTLLRQGQSSVQAFTHALHYSLPAVKDELGRYCNVVTICKCCRDVTWMKRCLI